MWQISIPHFRLHRQLHQGAKAYGICQAAGRNSMQIWASGCGPPRCWKSHLHLDGLLDQRARRAQLGIAQSTRDPAVPGVLCLWCKSELVCTEFRAPIVLAPPSRRLVGLAHTACRTWGWRSPQRSRRRPSVRTWCASPAAEPPLALHGECAVL